nr:AraC family transcriptional regulator [uncultured Fluviicola sp.]
MISNDIDFISVKDQSQDFPKHFHETFCISLIRNGIEKIELEERFLYSQAHCISITNPYEVHANPVVDNDVKVSFDTLYVSGELMAFLQNGKGIEFKNRQIRDSQINRTFIQLLEKLKCNNDSQSGLLLKDLMMQLYPYAQTSKDEAVSSFHSDYLTELVTYIEQNLENKLYLDELAKITNLNKYGFAKKFKSLTGMTPMSYVLMKKIFAAKTKISADCDLTDLAYAYNFTDISHFSHSFKKYIGISPKEYRNQLSGQLPRLYK